MAKATKDKATGTRKKRTWTNQQKELAVAKYIETGSLSAAARAIGAAVNTVKGWIQQQPPDEIEDARMKQRLKAVEEAWKIAGLYMTHLQEKTVVEKTGAKDSAIVVGTMIDKVSILLGEPQKHEVSGPNGGPIPVKLYDFDQAKYPDPE